MTWVERARGRASELLREPVGGRRALQARRRRSFACGDLQASARQFFSVLDNVGLLADDGYLVREASLVVVGDYFDYKAGADEDAALEGLMILRWLAEHAPDQVTILLGNHDVSRIMEMCPLTDPEFREAQALGHQIGGCRDDARRADLRAEFHARFPTVPTPSIATRDFSAYSEAQRDLLVELLLAGRVKLATVGSLPGSHEALITHAGVTVRELELLELGPNATASEIAAALNRHLVEAVGRVRGAWQRGEAASTPLDLSRLHLAGAAGEEGGGLLYHRPADPDATRRNKPDIAWEFDELRPRRFDPRRLPAGLIQVAGHTPHDKAASELPAWLAQGAARPAAGKIRTLNVQGDVVEYVVARSAPDGNKAQLYLIDGHLSHCDPRDYELFRLE